MPQILNGLASLSQKQLIRKYYFPYQLLPALPCFEWQVLVWSRNHSLFVGQPMCARRAWFQQMWRWFEPASPLSTQSSAKRSLRHIP